MRNTITAHACLTGSLAPWRAEHTAWTGAQNKPHAVSWKIPHHERIKAACQEALFKNKQRGRTRSPVCAKLSVCGTATTGVDLQQPACLVVRHCVPSHAQQLAHLVILQMHLLSPHLLTPHALGLASASQQKSWKPGFLQDTMRRNEMASRRAINIGGLCFGHQEKGDGVLELCGMRNMEG